MKRQTRQIEFTITHTQGTNMGNVTEGADSLKSPPPSKRYAFSPLPRSCSDRCRLFSCVGVLCWCSQPFLDLSIWMQRKIMHVPFELLLSSMSCLQLLGLTLSDDEI